MRGDYELREMGRRVPAIGGLGGLFACVLIAAHGAGAIKGKAWRRAARIFLWGCPRRRGGNAAALVHGFKEPLRNWALVVRGLLGRAGPVDDQQGALQFQEIPWTRKQPSLSIVALCLILAVVWRNPDMRCWSLRSYAAIGGALHLVALVRHRRISRTA